MWSIRILLCIVALLAPSAALAQDERRFEAFGSFQYLFADVDGAFDSFGGAGFNGEFAFFVNDWFGIGAEVGYNKGDIDFPPIPYVLSFDLDFSQWTMLFGPRFRIAQTDRFRVGAQAMAGLARATVALQLEIEDLVTGEGDNLSQVIPPIEVDENGSAFAALFGVHFDLRLNDRLVWRIAQPDLLVTTYGGEAQTHFRFATGIGYEF